MVPHSALLIVNRPFSAAGLTNLHFYEIVQEAVREIIRHVVQFGNTDSAPDIEGLAHLVRVLMLNEQFGTGYNAVGFFRLQMEELESIMREHPGDIASACRNLGSVFAEALRLMGRDQKTPEEFKVPLA